MYVRHSFDFNFNPAFMPRGLKNKDKQTRIVDALCASVRPAIVGSIEFVLDTLLTSGPNDPSGVCVRG